MASSISAGTTSSTALVATADTTGALVLQTNNGTTAFTLDASQNATFAGTATVNTVGSASATALTLKSAGTNALVLDTSQNLQFNSGYGSVATAYGCRAWVSYNGSSPGAIRGSGGVSSVTYNGTGNYTVNFSFTFVDANYCVAGAQQANAGSGQTGISIGATNPTTTACQIRTANVGGGYLDTPYMTAAFFR